jgi:hypothetical protein
MIVRKVRGQDKVGKIILSQSEVAFCKKMGVSIDKYMKETLLLIAQKRKWKWYLNKEKT